MSVIKKLNEIQKHLKAGKTEFNKFGGYNYRTAEGILDAVKPLLGDEYVILVSDEIINLGDRFYVRTTATLTDGKENIKADALAREALTKKGMDEGQITGASSSYAKKYALCNLFAISSGADFDEMDNTIQNNEHVKQTQKPPFKQVKKLDQKQDQKQSSNAENAVLKIMQTSNTDAQIAVFWRSLSKDDQAKYYRGLTDEQKEHLQLMLKNADEGAKK